MPAPRTRTRRRVRALAVALVVALLVGAGLLLAERALEGTGCASPPTPQEREEQESFVRAHLGDARDFEWTVMDCDDLGQAYLDFTTRQRGSAASASFLQDPACSPSTEPAASSGDVVCTSGGTVVDLSFEDHGAIETDGELAPRRR